MLSRPMTDIGELGSSLSRSRLAIGKGNRAVAVFGMPHQSLGALVLLNGWPMEMVAGRIASGRRPEGGCEKMPSLHCPERRVLQRDLCSLLRLCRYSDRLESQKSGWSCRCVVVPVRAESSMMQFVRLVRY